MTEACLLGEGAGLAFLRTRIDYLEHESFLISVLANKAYLCSVFDFIAF
jgi:hypothetical protein